MDIAQIQAMHAYIQQLNFQTASVSATSAPNLLAATNPLLNPNFINPSSGSADSSNLNPLTLALLYANQNITGGNNQVPSTPNITVPPTTTTTTSLPLTFPSQQSISTSAPATTPIFNPNNAQINNNLQSQIEQQAILNQLSQLIGTFGQQQSMAPANIFNPQQLQQPHLFQHQQPLPQPQPQHLRTSSMSKPPILTPSQPIQIPKPPKLSRQSLPSSTPENIRKRRHRDVEMLSQPSSQSGSPNNNNNINNNNISSSITDKLSRSRAFTCPETMKQQPQQQQLFQKEQSVQQHHPSSSPDKIAKFDPSCPLRHHPDNLSPPNQQAMMLEQITTAYILNALGESAFRASDPSTAATKDENKMKEMEKLSTPKSDVAGNIVKIPMSEIHRMIEDCYNDL